MSAGGLYAWRQSQSAELRGADFAALIFAAFRRGDTDNATRLAAAFPALRAEALARYNAPGGLISGDPGYQPADLGDDPDGDNTL